MVAHGTDDQKIADTIGTSAVAIKHRRWRLGIKRITFTRAAWTPEMIECLKEMRAEGYSMDQIAEKLGVTRCAVVGKAFHLKLPLLRRTLPPKAKAERQKQKRKPPKIIFEEVSDTDIPLEQRRSLLELTDETCRWPVGEVGHPDFFFCGATPIPCSPYCGQHHSRSVAS